MELNTCISKAQPLNKLQSCYARNLKNIQFYRFKEVTSFVVQLREQGPQGVLQKCKRCNCDSMVHWVQKLLFLWLSIMIYLFTWSNTKFFHTELQYFFTMICMSLLLLIIQDQFQRLDEINNLSTAAQDVKMILKCVSKQNLERFKASSKVQVLQVQFSKIVKQLWIWGRGLVLETILQRSSW